MKILQLFFLSFLIAACGGSSSTNADESTEALEEEIEETAETEAVQEEEEPVEKTLSNEDSAYLNSIMDELKGIDKFFVTDSYRRLHAVLVRKEDPRATKVAELIEGVEFNEPAEYYITDYKPKNGYIAYTPGPVDYFIDMVYWNVSDGSQLIATQGKSCGPVCDVEISFKSHKDGNYLPLENVIPDQKMLSEKLAPGSTTDQEPYEFEFILPIQGKNLKYCLGDDCLTLAWNDGSFTLKE